MNQQENDVVFIADEVTINTNTLLDFLDGRSKILSLHLGRTYEMVMMAGESLEIADTVLNEEAERGRKEIGSATYVPNNKQKIKQTRIRTTEVRRPRSRHRRNILAEL